jgi:hypothetical protein
VSTPISPWDHFAEKRSPDARFVAVFDDAMEIAMGGPLRGVLRVRGGVETKPIIQIENAGSSFVWSSDSKVIAVPRWTDRRKQRICFVSVPSGEIDELAEIYDVVQLESFDECRLIGADSPIYRPRPIDLTFRQRQR